MATYSPSKITKDGNTYNFRDTTKIPLAGSNQISGSLIPSTDNAYDLGDSTYGFRSIYTNKLYLKGSTIFNVVDNNYICIGGATVQANGANLTLNGKNRSTSTGEFKLEARDGTNTRQLIGKPDGTLSWNGNIKTSKITHSVDNNFLQICGGTDIAKGAVIQLNGKDLTTDTGFVSITAKNGTQSNGFQIRPNGDTLLTNCLVFYGNTDNSTDIGAPAYRYKVIYATTGTINTSDARFKNSVKDIDNALLDAWGNIEPKQFKFNDATEKKGEKARYHTGYLAQDIQTECEKQGINASDYGLFCYDEWDEQEEVSEEIETEKDGKKVKEKRIIQPKREKGNIFALRYEEALIVECAYLRKKNKELQEQLDKVIARLDKLDGVQTK